MDKSKVYKLSSISLYLSSLSLALTAVVLFMKGIWIIGTIVSVIVVVALYMAFVLLRSAYEEHKKPKENE